MTMKILRTGRVLSAALALGALAAAGPVTELAAQDTRVRVQRDDCRCVDNDGKPIENCTCFAMPNVERIVTSALSGFRGRARLGVTLTSGDDHRGARVASVMEDGPADEAGIREGDIITRVDGKSLLEPLSADVEEDLDEDEALPTQRLMALVQEIEPGQEVSIEYLRDGERQTTTLEARDLNSWSFAFSGPDEDQMIHLRDEMKNLELSAGRLRVMAPRSPRGLRDIQVWTDSSSAPRAFFSQPGGNSWVFAHEEGPEALLRQCPSSEDTEARAFMVFSDQCPGGMEFTDLKPGLADYFGTAEGVLVTDVHEESKVGVQPGDVILSVGDRPATDADRLRRILESYAGDEEVTLRIMRQKREMSIRGNLGR